MFEIVMVVIIAYLFTLYDSCHKAKAKKRVSHVGWRSGQLRAQRQLKRYGFRFKL